MKKKLVRIDMEFEVEWDEVARAEWGGIEPDEIDVERRILYSVIGSRPNLQYKDGMRIVSVESYKDSFYRNGDVPKDYKCSKCGAQGIKMWRQYNTFADHIELMCGQCALEDQGKKGPLDDRGMRQSEVDNEKTDQIGWLVPAIPTEDESTFWGYTSVPASGVRWWKALPTKVNNDEDFA